MSPRQGVSERLSVSPSFGLKLSPIKTFFSLMILIFLAEIIAMTILYVLDISSYLVESLLDGVIMILLILPGLYYLQLNPLWKEINERIHAEQALRTSEELLGKVLELLPIGVWILDKSGNVIHGNPASLDIWAGARYVGIEHYDEYKGWWTETGERIASEEWAAARSIAYGETILGEEIEIECFDGSHKIILNSAVPILDDQETIQGAIAVNQDITEKKHSEMALIQTNELLERFFDSIHTLIAYMDRDFNFIRVNEAYARAGGHPAEFYIGKNHFDLYPHEENQSIFEKVVETREAVFIFEKAFEYGEFPERGVTYWDWGLQPVQSTTGTVEGVVLSLVEVTERKRAQLALHEAFDELELRVQERTEELKVAISELEDEISVRQQAEEKLKITLEKLRTMESIVNRGPVMLLLWRVVPDIWPVELVSDNVESILGFSADDFVSGYATWSGIIHPGDAPRLEAEVKKYLEQGVLEWSQEYRMLTKSGETRWVRDWSKALADSTGAITHIQALAVDVTERVRMKEELHQSQEDLARAQEVGQLGSWRLDVRRNVLTWSDENHRIFGVPRGVPMNYESFLELIHPDDRSYVDKQWNAGLRGKPYDIEHRILVEGLVKWVREKAYLEYDESGALLGGFGITQDITDLKQAEHQLVAAFADIERERNRLLAVMEALPVGVAILDANGGSVQVNREYEQIWSGPRPEVHSVSDYVVFNAWWADSGLPVQPDEWASAIAVQKGEAVIGQLMRIKRFDGEQAYVLNSGVPIFDDQGEIAGCAVALMDITDRKQMEEELVRANEELEERVRQRSEEVMIERQRLFSVLETLPAMVCLLTADHQVVFTNRSFREKFGESRGRRCYEYRFGHAEPCEFCEAFRVLETGLPHDWEVIAPDGSVIEAHDFPFTDVDGSLMVLEMDIDITDRRKAEAELKRRNLELLALSDSERQQRQVAETLRGAAIALAQTLDLDTVLCTLIRHICDVSRADVVGIVLPKSEASFGAYKLERSDVCPDLDRRTFISVDNDDHPFMQTIASTHESLLIRDVVEEPGWVSYPGSESIHNYLILPILVNDRLFGVAVLGKTEAGYFTEEHAQWAEALIGQAVVALQNASLYEQVRSSSQSLQALAHNLVEVQENERASIARELHDEAGQSLSSLRISLGRLEQETDCPPFIQGRLQEMKALTDNLLEEMHRLAMGLRPIVLDRLGLVAALDQYANNLNSRELVVKFKAIGFEGERLPQDVESSLYRIVQEALTNVVRHANARNAGVLLERGESRVKIFIEDDGIGLASDAIEGKDRLGLFGMRERAEMLGGSLTIESSPGEGTAIIVEVPYVHSSLDR